MARPNKDTERQMRAARDIVLNVVSGEFQGDVQCALAQLREKNPRAYLDALAKFLPYALPRMEAVQTTEGKPSLSWMNGPAKKGFEWFDKTQLT